VVFLTLFDQYAGFIEQAGKKIHRARYEEARRMFSALEDAHRIRIIDRLEKDISLYGEILGAGEKLVDSRRLLWRYLAKSGLIPCSDIFDKLGDNDVVEVYSMEQVHLCQNFNFFDWVSVPLEKIFCEAWYKSTKREPAIEQRIYESAIRVFSGQVRTTLDPEVPWHRIDEVDSELLFSFELRLKWLSPVFEKGQVMGLISVSECKNLQSTVAE
jgi:hypothetical protein